MMKLILADGENEAREFSLHKPITEIGRRSNNDIQLRSREVSGQHAMIERQGDKFVLIDRGSTNGTSVNGERIAAPTVLAEGDALRIGKFKLTAQVMAEALADGEDGEPDDIPMAMPADNERDNAAVGNAVIKIQSGIKAGTAVNINKPVTTIGRPGVQVIAINRQSDGFFALHVETIQSDDKATVNDQVLDDAPVRLNHGDVLRVAGTEIAFEVEFSS